VKSLAALHRDGVSARSNHEYVYGGRLLPQRQAP
jgi:hypothetical protein